MAALAALGAAVSTPADRVRAQAPGPVVTERSVKTWTVARGIAPAGPLDLSFDVGSRSAVVVWAAPDGVWMRRAALDSASFEAPRQVMKGAGFAVPRVEVLPAEGAATNGDLLLVVQHRGHVVARGLSGDGSPVGPSTLLSRGLKPNHWGASTLATADGDVVVAWVHVHRSQRILVTRLNRAGRRIGELRAVKAPGVPPLLAERPGADAPGFLLGTEDLEGHLVRAFDREGEQVSLERHRRLWPVALLPRDAGSLLSLSVVHEDLRGHRLVARQLDGAGALLTRLGSIGPRLDRFSRLQDMVVGAAAEEGSGVAVTYGRGVHAHELETLDLFLFGPDLQPRGGRRHRLAEGSVGAVSRPAWTDRGEVLVAWHDRSPDRLVLGVVAAFD